MWTKHFRLVDVSKLNVNQPQIDNNGTRGSSTNLSSFLPEVYAGHPNRIQRYYQYADMARDSDIAVALETIAEFCTQTEEQNKEPFDIVYNDTASDAEITIIKKTLTKWVKLNKFKQRLFDIFKETLTAGDQVFICDPETHEWLWCDHFNVEMVKVDQRTKDAEQYLIRNLEYNGLAQYATGVADPTNFRSPFGAGVSAARPAGVGASSGNSMFNLAGQGRDSRNAIMGNQAQHNLHAVDAKNVIHLSLSSGMDANWPFGKSILEPVFKTFKQKELLEDAILIYRVQRAPERRIFYIDVGTMNAQRAQAHIEQVKMDIHQRRIPNRTGGGSSIMDAAYNPLSMVEDYFFAQSADGRGSKVETLAGGDNLGEIGDLSFFTKKLARGLHIPQSYLSMGDDGNNVSFNDGKLGAAVIQEFRFNKYCMRLQNTLAPVFDKAFKKYLEHCGFEIDDSLFELAFHTPQNFAKYRQMEIDAQQVGVYQQVADNKLLSARFKLERFLNLSEEEILRNEKLWAEENAAKVKKATGSTPAETDPSADLTSVGVRGGGFDDFGDDFGGDDLGGDDLGGDDLGGDSMGGETPPPPPPSGGGGGGPAI